VLSSTGINLYGSPFGTDHSGNDIAVLDNGMMVLISDQTENSVQCWKGAIEGYRARYWQSDNIQVTDIGIGKVETDNNDYIYIPHPYRGIVSILDRVGRPIEYLTLKETHPFTPYDMSVSVTGDSIFVIEAAGNGPTKLHLWVKQASPVSDNLGSKGSRTHSSR
jgi:hypothetical protein